MKKGDKKSFPTNYLNNLKKNKPPEGNIMVLSVTEKQFSDIEFILGEFETDVINTTDRIVVIE